MSKNTDDLKGFTVGMKTINATIFAFAAGLFMLIPSPMLDAYDGLVSAVFLGAMCGGVILLCCDWTRHNAQHALTPELARHYKRVPLGFMRIVAAACLWIAWIMLLVTVLLFIVDLFR